MIREEALKIAVDWYKSGDEDYGDFIQMIDDLLEAATKAEREECAKVCEGLYSKDYYEDGKAFATAIRNRSNES